MFLFLLKVKQKQFQISDRIKSSESQIYQGFQRTHIKNNATLVS